MRKVIVSSITAALVSLSSAPVSARTIETIRLDKSILAPTHSRVGQVLPKIVGGNAATEGQNRWITSLQFNGSHFCGGALIADRWVLTAAHCVEGESASGNSFSVWIGGNDQQQPSQGVQLDVDQIISHEQYNSGTLLNDIALLRLAEAAPQELPRVQLANAPIMSGPAAPNQPVTVSGWGVLAENGSLPNQLHEVVVPVVSGSTCNAPEAYNGQISANQICAGLREGGKDSCQGDSGGPLWLNFEGQDYHVGIVSFGEGCARPDKYGVYTRTASYLDWIAERTNGDSGGGGGNDGGGDQCPNPDDGNGGDDGGNGNGTALQNGEIRQSLSGGVNSEQQFTIEVPAGTSSLTIEIFGGSGDADLYVAFDRQATTSDADFVPFLAGNDERVDVSQPSAGTWHITLVGFDSYDNVSLVAQYN